MNCPGCNNTMKEVKTSSHYGIPIVLDQCPGCGGVWFDDSELYRTKHGAAQEIEELLDASKLRKVSELNQDLNCPRDKTKLIPIPDHHFFNTVQIDTCPKCSGLWFNYGEFITFQNERARRQEERKNKAQKELDKKKGSELDEAIRKKAIALMKLYSELEKKNKRNKNERMVETVAYLIIMLLRILFRR